MNPFILIGLGLVAVGGFLEGRKKSKKDLTGENPDAITQPDSKNRAKNEPDPEKPDSANSGGGGD